MAKISANEGFNLGAIKLPLRLLILVLEEMLKRGLVNISYCPEAPVGAGVVRCGWLKYTLVAGVVDAPSHAGVDPLVVP